MLARPAPLVMQVAGMHSRARTRDARSTPLRGAWRAACAADAHNARAPLSAHQVADSEHDLVVAARWRGGRGVEVDGGHAGAGQVDASGVRQRHQRRLEHRTLLRLRRRGVQQRGARERQRQEGAERRHVSALRESEAEEVESASKRRPRCVHHPCRTRQAVLGRRVSIAATRTAPCKPQAGTRSSMRSRARFRPFCLCVAPPPALAAPPAARPGRRLHTQLVSTLDPCQARALTRQGVMPRIAVAVHCDALTCTTAGSSCSIAQRAGGSGKRTPRKNTRAHATSVRVPRRQRCARVHAHRLPLSTRRTPPHPLVRGRGAQYIASGRVRVSGCHSNC
jgi:hypothetical protein